MADLQSLVQQLSSLTVLEASELKKLLEAEWGVEASSGGGFAIPAGLFAGAGAAGGGAAAAAEPVEEQTEFNVVLKDVGPKKINVIKAVRSFTNLGLAEAKTLVDGAPATVLEAVSKEVADDAKANLEAEGAVVELK